MTDRTLTDEDCRCLQGVPIRGIVVGRLNLTDDGITALRELPALEELAVWGGGVTDSDMERLCTLPLLKKLTVQKSEITDVGLSHIRSLKRLTRRPFLHVPEDHE